MINLMGTMIGLECAESLPIFPFISGVAGLFVLEWSPCARSQAASPQRFIRTTPCRPSRGMLVSWKTKCGEIWQLGRRLLLLKPFTQSRICKNGESQPQKCIYLIWNFNQKAGLWFVLQGYPVFSISFLSYPFSINCNPLRRPHRRHPNDVTCKLPSSFATFQSG